MNRKKEACHCKNITYGMIEVPSRQVQKILMKFRRLPDLVQDAENAEILSAAW